MTLANRGKPSCMAGFTDRTARPMAQPSRTSHHHRRHLRKSYAKATGLLMMIAIYLGKTYTRCSSEHPTLYWRKAGLGNGIPKSSSPGVTMMWPSRDSWTGNHSPTPRALRVPSMPISRSRMATPSKVIRPSIWTAQNERAAADPDERYSISACSRSRTCYVQMEKNPGLSGFAISWNSRSRIRFDIPVRSCPGHVRTCGIY